MTLENTLTSLSWIYLPWKGGVCTGNVDVISVREILMMLHKPVHFQQSNVYLSVQSTEWLLERYKGRDQERDRMIKTDKQDLIHPFDKE